MTVRERQEYRALRATIRERGTARVCIFAGGIAAWAATAIATAAVASSPVATLLPLVVLASMFEAVFALHVGVERIGRYLQVFHETQDADASARWEDIAMRFGRPTGAATTDALFIVPFAIAALCNIAPALILEPARVEMVFVGGAHALFALRLVVARQAAGRQRGIDVDRFAELKSSNQNLKLKTHT